MQVFSLLKIPTIIILFSLIYHCRRMHYADAIVYLKENNITKDDGTFYEFGEVSGVCGCDFVISLNFRRIYLKHRKEK